VTIARLRDCGVDEVIFNVHHFADMMVSYLQAHDLGIRVEVSREDDILLDTGGGLKKAAWFFEDGEAFFVHNVDVLSTIDLRQIMKDHLESGALATLAVQKRETSRYLLFDDDLQLCGRRAGPDLEPEIVRPSRQMEALAFSGIHVISPRIFPLLTEDGAFSIIPAYLRLAGEGEKIRAFRADEYYWRDLGRPENVAKAAEEMGDWFNF
jgi:NDP-sugar pyrophosphorylase family protein